MKARKPMNDPESRRVRLKSITKLIDILFLTKAVPRMMWARSHNKKWYLVDFG